MTDEHYMEMTLAEAQLAADRGEIPIGAVLVHQGEIIARGHNLRETLPDATAHAEMLVIREACRKLKRWRLRGCTLYVTLEPCPMCAGAIVNSRIDRLVYGVGDSKSGAVDSIFNITDHAALNHRVEVRAGVLEESCRRLLQTFFRQRRRSLRD